MGIVTIHHRKFDIDCIIFDKDDTLIEFNALWGPRTKKWIEAVIQSLDLTNEVQENMYAVLGYSLEQECVLAESPLAVASTGTLTTLIAGVLYQQGIPWHEAYKHAISCAQDTVLALIDPAEIRPKGDVTGVMHQLVQANIRIAVITSDDRRMTEDTLAILGIKDIVSFVVCGDDPVPNKPAPDALWQVAEYFHIDASRIMMVGDTASDMQFAINAGAGFRIGIASNSGNVALLTALADEVVPSIDEFEIQ